VLTVHLGPEQVVAGLSLDFVDHISASEIEACVERLEAKLKAEVPEVTSVFVKPQTLRLWTERRDRIVNAEAETPVPEGG
jgi:divalent metal cation (Fe/Co/Zn/Cd) transporter